VLSTHLWRDLFGSDPSIVGKSIRIANGPQQPATIVGVAPPELDVPRGVDFWLNFSITPQSTGHGFDGFVRIRPARVSSGCRAKWPAPWRASPTTTDAW
jgi:hypothetical protein